MARIDKLKEEIGWLKVVFAILVATEISLLAWLVQNYQHADTVLLLIAAAVVLLFGKGIISVDSLARSKIHQLEDL